MNSIIDQGQALQFLKDSNVVALPTETVYGLAGRVASDKALKKIFATKERPFFDPLIIHVSDLNMAENWAHFDPLSRTLAQKFWPGPLTLVLNKKNNVSDLITNGGSTVAVRSPDHEIFQSLLKSLQEPLAAPSANMFGKTSPTTAQHVCEEFANQVAVVDGGDCQRGIESTVVQVSSDQTELTLLRPGIIHSKDLENFFKKNNLSVKVITKTQSHVPGHLKNHYQPTVPFVLVKKPPPEKDCEDELYKIKQVPWTEWQLPNDPTLSARVLYSDLRNFSKKGAPVFLKVDSLWLKTPSWMGLLDRLQKASTGTLDHEGLSWVYTPK